jgi:hypothetical protein
MNIPEISNERIREMLKTIRPLVKQDGKLHCIKWIDTRKVAFTWAPVLDGEVRATEIVAKIRTLHSFGYQGLFKPSIAEVLAQIPKELIDKVRGFSLEGPRTADDLNREREALDEGFHVAITTLYGRVERIDGGVVPAVLPKAADEADYDHT